MLSIYEKLRHFNEVILKDAASERDEILRQLEESTQKRIDLEKSKFEEQARQMLYKETVQAENDKNNRISKAIIDSRHLLVKKREEIVNTILKDTRSLLEDFIKKDEAYLPYLARIIRQACNSAGDGDLVVYLRPEDAQRLAPLMDEVKKDLPPNTVFEQTNDDIIGGCKVFNKTTNTVVDETLAGKLEGSRDKVLEICDLKI